MFGFIRHVVITLSWIVNFTIIVLSFVNYTMETCNMGKLFMFTRNLLKITNKKIQNNKNNSQTFDYKRAKLML